MRLKDTFITHDSDGEQVLIDVTSSFAGLVRRFVRHFYHTIWFTTEQTEDFTVSVCVSVNFYICVL